MVSPIRVIIVVVFLLGLAGVFRIFGPPSKSERLVLLVIMKQPAAIIFFVAGLLPLSAGGAFILTPMISDAPNPRWAPPLLRVFLLISVACFSGGARLSLKEAGARAKVLRWANVVGLGISVGLILMILLSFILGSRLTW